MSRFLLDMGVSPKVIEMLRHLGHEAEHVASCGMADADDRQIFDRAVREDQIVITTDLDFGHLAVMRRQPFPGLILLRLDNPTAARMSDCLQRFLADRPEDDYRSAIIILEPGRWRRTAIPLEPG
jgi:predicted nuclease of predicted toxin-antitoxin system